MNRKVVISVNTAWNIHNFRAGLVRALVRQGYDVMVVARQDEYASRLAALGCRFKMLALDNHGTSPTRDLALLIKYRRVLQSVRPLVYLGYTIKPNVYGSIAANGLDIPVINNIAGLGATFLNNPVMTCVAKQLYRLSLRRSERVFFQNADDRKLFVQAGLSSPHAADVLPGSGIDLAHFRPMPSAPAERERRPFRFLLIARMLRDKGVEEYAAAAAIVRRYAPEVEFQLLGALDKDNPNSIPASRIEDWERSGLVRYLHQSDDVRPFIAHADCVVLPSYREGVPHSLLEAAAMARPIIATDVAGCRDVVDHSVNGLLCQVKSGEDLAEKMLLMQRMSTEQRAMMGAAGRTKVTRQFDEKIVIGKYLHAITQIEARNQRSARHLLEPLAET